LVEKFNDYGVDSVAEIDTNFEGIWTLYKNTRN
jgi:hypothetical protein